jgi:hypothetical protein
MKNKDLAVVGLLMAATWNLSKGPNDAQFRVIETDAPSYLNEKIEQTAYFFEDAFSSSANIKYLINLPTCQPILFIKNVDAR